MAIEFQLHRDLMVILLLQACPFMYDAEVVVVPLLIMHVDFCHQGSMLRETSDCKRGLGD